MDVRAWEIQIDNEKFFLVHDDFPTMISLESTSLQGDKLITQLKTNSINTGTKKLNSLTEMSATKLRLLAAVFIPGMLLTGAFSLYWLWTNVLPIYGRIYRDAPVIEVPYLAFGLLMAPPAVIIAVLGASIAAWNGKKFDPPRSSKLYRFQNMMFSSSLKTMIYIVPTLMILTTLVLLARGYSPCPKLLISGSAWQLFWVNDERACFKPSRYINGNWPCMIIGDKEVCIQVDGR